MNIPDIPEGFTGIVLHPTMLWSTAELEPCEVGLIDPFVAGYTTDPNALAFAARVTTAMRADMTRAMEGRLAILTGGGVDGLRKTAARENWLELEQGISQVCVELLWTALLMPPAVDSDCLHGERALVSLLDKDGAPSVCEALLQAIEIPSLCNCTLELVARALPLIHDAAPGICVESEDWFWWTYKTRYEPLPRCDVRSYEYLAQRIADSLAAMPVFQGLLITGSFAEEDKHDGFNDLDMYCYCSSLPTKKMRRDFFARLGLDSPGSSLAFEYLKLDGVDVHVCMPLIENQQLALERLWQCGDESNCGHFLNPAFAASAYHLARGRILRDPTGTLARWQAQVTEYPPALRRNIHQIWRPMWKRYAARTHQALEAADRIHALIALSRCREAYLRILLADNNVYCDPNPPLKWLLHEVQRLQGPERDTLVRAVDSARFDGVRTLPDQFARLNALWGEMEC